MNNVRLSLETGNSRRDEPAIRNWITFLNDLYTEYVQNTTLLSIRSRLIYDRRFPTLRELVDITKVIRDAYIANGVNISYSNALTNLYTEPPIIVAFNKVISDIIAGSVTSGSVLPIDPETISNKDHWLDANEFNVGIIPAGTIITLKGSSAAQFTVVGNTLECYVNSAGKKALKFDGTVWLNSTNSSLFTKYHQMSTSPSISFVGKIGNAENPDAAYCLFGGNGTTSNAHGAVAFFDNRVLANPKGARYQTTRNVGGSFPVNAIATQLIQYGIRTSLHYTFHLGIVKDRMRIYSQSELVNVTDITRSSVNTSSGLGTAVGHSSSNSTYTFQIGAGGNNASPFVGEIEQLMFATAQSYDLITTRGLDKFWGFNYQFGKSSYRYVYNTQTITDQYLISGGYFKTADKSKTIYTAARGGSHVIGIGADDKQGVQAISTDNGASFPASLTNIMSDASTSPHNLTGAILPNGELWQVYSKWINSTGYTGMFYRKAVDPYTSYSAETEIILPIEATSVLTAIVPHDIGKLRDNGDVLIPWYGTNVGNTQNQIWVMRASSNGTVFNHYNVFTSTTEYVNECSIAGVGTTWILCARVELAANIVSPGTYRHRFFKSTDDGVTWTYLNEDAIAIRRYVYPHPPVIHTFLLNGQWVFEFSFVDRGERRWHFIYCLWSDFITNGPAALTSKTVYYFDNRHFGASGAGGYRSGYPTFIHPDNDIKIEGFYGAETVNDSVMTVNFFKVDNEHGWKVAQELGI